MARQVLDRKWTQSQICGGSVALTKLVPRSLSFPLSSGHRNAHTQLTHLRLLQLLICKEKYLRWCILMNLYNLFTFFLPALRGKMEAFSPIRVQTIRLVREVRHFCGEMLDSPHSSFCIPPPPLDQFDTIFALFPKSGLAVTGSCSCMSHWYGAPVPPVCSGEFMFALAHSWKERLHLNIV